MKLAEEDIAFIAEGLPGLEVAPPQIRALAELLEGDREAKLFAAAATLQRIIFGGAPLDRFPKRAREATFGFVPVGPALAEAPRFVDRFRASPRFVFGVSIHAEADGEASDQFLAGEVTYADRNFPVVVTQSRLRRESIPPHPDYPTKVGSGTCWVRSSDSSAPWDYGILTARHVVDHLTVGDAVSLNASTAHSSPAKGAVADLGACAIDAAIIEIDESDWPSTLRPLGMAGPFPRPLAPGTDVRLDGRYTAAKSCKSLSHHPLPHYWGAMMGQRLVIDDHGRGGDSGGLVREAKTGLGIGVYMGRIDDGAGGHNGLCQDLYQASVYLEADLYL